MENMFAADNEFISEALSAIDQAQSKYPRNSYAWNELGRIFKDLASLEGRLEDHPLDRLARIGKYLERQNDLAFCEYRHAGTELSFGDWRHVVNPLYDKWQAVGDALTIVRDVETQMAMQDEEARYAAND